jgi:polar amino acid transport system substrate-binding protein
MKKHVHYFIVLLVINIIVVPWVHAGEKFVFSTFEDSGLTLIEEPILREVYRQMGFEIEIRQYPAERSLRMANEGIVDGEVARLAVVREKYLNLVMIPVPLHNLKLVVFAKNVRFSVRGYESLKPYTVVTLIGYKHFEKKFKEYGIRYHQVANYRQIFKTLDAERHDLALLTQPDGLRTLRELRLKGIANLDPPIENIPIYHFVHKKHRHLVPQIAATLRDLEKKGVLEKIENRVIADLTKPW